MPKPRFRDKQSFYPPKNNKFVIWFVKLLMPFVRKILLGNLKLKVSDSDLKRLKELAKGPLLLLPNHPTEDDPYVFLELARRSGLIFNSVAAREVFDWNGGLRGLFFQWLGSYSVIRGAADRESFKTSRELLVKGRHPLIIFIEGEITNENDTLIPFEPGVVQLGFWAQEELQKKPEANGLNLMPVAIKYFYDPGAELAIKQSLERLEKALNLQRATNEPAYVRLQKIGGKVLGLQEKRLNIASSASSVNERIEAVKEKVLSKLETFLDLLKVGSSSLDRIRAIRNRMDKNIYAYCEPREPLSDYEEALLEQGRNQYKEFYDELERLVNFLVLHEGYIPQKEAPERFIEVLRRLEWEVLGAPKINYGRTALLKFGETINLKNHFERYTTDRKKTVVTLAAALEDNMRNLLSNMQQA
jgi:1-acyl-sn-glycerol-3-phosphate acyltransferase